MIRSVIIVFFSAFLLGDLHGQSFGNINIALPFDQSFEQFEYQTLVIENLQSAPSDMKKETVLMNQIPNVYRHDQLGMFCKFDVALDSGSKMALRFRIGTVSGVDELERKGPTRYHFELSQEH